LPSPPLPLARWNKRRVHIARAKRSSPFPNPCNYTETHVLRALTIAISLLLTVILTKPSSPQSSKHQLDLIVLPGSLDKAALQTFTIKLINHSEHNIWIPDPAIQCEDSVNGYLWLRVELLDGSVPGFGCVLDRYRPKSVLDRAHEWKILAPGATMEETIPLAKLHLGFGHPEIRDFWGEYFPPTVTATEERVLEERGIDFPSQRLVSAHQTRALGPDSGRPLEQHAP
jgi:hypothetical protein